MFVLCKRGIGEFVSVVEGNNAMIADGDVLSPSASEVVYEIPGKIGSNNPPAWQGLRLHVPSLTLSVNPEARVPTLSLAVNAPPADERGIDYRVITRPGLRLSAVVQKLNMATNQPIVDRDEFVFVTVTGGSRVYSPDGEPTDRVMLTRGSASFELELPNSQAMLAVVCYIPTDNRCLITCRIKVV